MNLLLRPKLFSPRPYRPKFRLDRALPASDDVLDVEDDEIVVVIVAMSDRLEFA